MDIDEIEDILNQIMSDEFHTILEDDSGYLVRIIPEADFSPTDPCFLGGETSRGTV